VDDDDPVACVTTGDNGAEGFEGAAVAAAVEALACADVTPDASAVAAAVEAINTGETGDIDSGEGDHGSLTGDGTRVVTFLGLALVAAVSHFLVSASD
jgi:hypothetical protein